MKLKLKKGVTSKLLRIFVQDSSKSDGSGLTGLTNSSSGLTWHYIREGDSSPTSVTLASATVGTFTSGGFKEVSSANMPGVYEIGVPDAALASGANSVVMMLKGAANMIPVPIEIELDAVDYQDSTRYGLSALPNAAAAASGGLPTVDSSNAIKVQSGTGANQVSLAAGLVTVGTNNDKTGYALTSGEETAIANAVATRACEGSVTLEQAIRLLLAAEGGKLSGAATTTIKIRNLADTKDRVTATVDADGNRTAVTLDLT